MVFRAMGLSCGSAGRRGRDVVGGPVPCLLSTASSSRLACLICFGLLFTLGGSPSGAWAQTNLVDNGSFETPVVASGFVSRSAGFSLGGWTVGGGGIDQLSSDWQPAAGSQSIDLNRLSQGSVFQDLATAPGATYVLRYAKAGNAAGVVQTTTSVRWNGSEIAQTRFDTTGHSPASMGWIYETRTVTAVGPTTRLEFASLAPGGGFGPALDDVSVVAAPPPPPPDRDGDGLPDVSDACPTTPAATANGCPPFISPVVAAPAPTALPPPVIGRVVNVEPIRGEVFVALPAATAQASRSVPGLKGKRFIPLSQARQIPVGSVLDTRRGAVRLTSARDAQGTSQAGEFGAGVFQIVQSRQAKAKGLTELRLKGASFRSCRRAGHGKNASSARHDRRAIRRLRGNARGRFRTRGRYSAATVRGTTWVVTDRCDGTLTKVTRGTVAVRDIRRRRTILLRAGRAYLARASR